MTSLAAAERAALADALTEVGPDAVTLCAGWTAHDLAAHLVARERRPDSTPGLVLGPLAGWTERVRRHVAQRPWPVLVSQVRSGPPRTSPFALPGVDAAVNLTEHFVHCEDVLRARPGRQPRDLAPDLQDALWRVLAVRGRALLRASPVGVALATPDGRRRTVLDRGPQVVLTGEPAELVLYAFGRTGSARVEVGGEPRAVEAFRATRLAV